MDALIQVEIRKNGKGKAYDVVVECASALETGRVLLRTSDGIVTVPEAVITMAFPAVRPVSDTEAELLKIFKSFGAY